MDNQPLVEILCKIAHRMPWEEWDLTEVEHDVLDACTGPQIAEIAYQKNLPFKRLLMNADELVEKHNENVQRTVLETLRDLQRDLMSDLPRRPKTPPPDPVEVERRILTEVIEEVAGAAPINNEQEELAEEEPIDIYEEAKRRGIQLPAFLADPFPNEQSSNDPSLQRDHSVTPLRQQSLNDGGAAISFDELPEATVDEMAEMGHFAGDVGKQLFNSLLARERTSNDEIRELVRQRQSLVLANFINPPISREPSLSGDIPLEPEQIEIGAATRTPESNENDAAPPVAQPEESILPIRDQQEAAVEQVEPPPADPPAEVVLSQPKQKKRRRKPRKQRSPSPTEDVEYPEIHRELIRHKQKARKMRQNQPMVRVFPMMDIFAGIDEYGSDYVSNLTVDNAEASIVQMNPLPERSINVVPKVKAPGNIPEAELPHNVPEALDARKAASPPNISKALAPKFQLDIPDKAPLDIPDEIPLDIRGAESLINDILEVPCVQMNPLPVANDIEMPEAPLIIAEDPALNIPKELPLDTCSAEVDQNIPQASQLDIREPAAPMDDILEVPNVQMNTLHDIDLPEAPALEVRKAAPPVEIPAALPIETRGAEAQQPMNDVLEPPMDIELPSDRHVTKRPRYDTITSLLAPGVSLIPGIRDVPASEPNGKQFTAADMAYSYLNEKSQQALMTPEEKSMTTDELILHQVRQAEKEKAAEKSVASRPKTDAQPEPVLYQKFQGKGETMVRFVGLDNNIEEHPEYAIETASIYLQLRFFLAEHQWRRMKWDDIWENFEIPEKKTTKQMLEMRLYLLNDKGLIHLHEDDEGTILEVEIKVKPQGAKGKQAKQAQTAAGK